MSAINKNVLGHAPCPGCDNERAEIKAQKCGQKLYLFCPECNLQVFARNPAQEAKFRRALEVKAPEPNNHGKEEARPEPEKAPVTAAAAAPEPKKAAQVSNLGAALSFLTGKKG